MIIARFNGRSLKLVEIDLSISFDLVFYLFVDARREIFFATYIREWYIVDQVRQSRFEQILAASSAAMLHFEAGWLKNVYLTSQL